MAALLEWLKWLIGLARPDNLRALAEMGGAWWIAYLVMAAIVFSETGLLVGFFLPGDSLLFAAGLLASQKVFDIVGLLVLLSVAAVLGDAVNFALGRQFSEHVFERGRLRFVKHSHLLAAKAFYDKHGGKAIILARFVPLVRTFTPFVAGVARMEYHHFAIYNIVGGIGWVVSMTMAGYWLGQIPWIRDHFEMVVVGIVLVSVLPVVVSVVKAWLAKSRQAKLAALDEPR